MTPQPSLSPRPARIAALAAAVLLLLALPGAAAEQRFAELGRCELEGGGAIEPCRIGYRLLGTPNEAKDNGILVPTWFTGTSAELEELIAPALEGEPYFVILADAFAGGVSSSPSTSPTQAGAAFPEITIRDMVRAHHRLVTETLGLDRLHAVVGLSMGGMQALEWAVAVPGFAARTVSVIGSPRLAPFDLLLWETRLQLLDLYRECRCQDALRLAASVSMLGLDPEIVAERVGARTVGELIDERAAALPTEIAVTWDDERQVRAMIGHDIARDFGGEMARAVRAMKTDLLIVVAAKDRTVTPGPALELAELAGAETVVLESACGHAAPWCEAESFGATLRAFLARPVVP